MNHLPNFRLGSGNIKFKRMTILQQYLEANRLVEQEYGGVELQILEGEVPAELHGTLFRNGNGRFEHQGVIYKHLFDGDGMVSAFTITEGRIRYRNRYVRTREFEEEERKGRMLHRSFGTNIPGGFLRNMLKIHFKNAANTSVIYHGGKLLALWEGGLPHLLDPATLNTIARYDYEGVLHNDFSPIDRIIMPELPFSAHPKEHPGNGKLYNFGTAAGTKQRLILYEVSPEGQAEITGALPMDQLYFTHDFIVTEEGQRIFFLIPTAFHLWRSFMGFDPPVDAIESDPSQPVRVVVFDGEEVHEHTTDYSFIFHYANGYRREDGTIIIDAFTMPGFPAALDMRKAFRGEKTDAPQGLLNRYYIRPGQTEVERELISDYPAELPTHHPDRTGRPYRYVWGIGERPGSDRELLYGVVKIDVEKRRTEIVDLYPQLPGEPLFVPRPDAESEDEGWLLTLCFDPEATSTYLYIFDARSLEQIAKAKLPHNMPVGFHGKWAPEVW